MSREEHEELDRLLRRAYRSVPLDQPDLRKPVLRRVRESSTTRPRSGPEPETRARRGLSRGVRWGLRVYWLATGVGATLLMARAAAAGPEPLAVTLAAVAAAPLLVAVTTLTRATGRTTAELIARAL